MLLLLLQLEETDSAQVELQQLARHKLFFRRMQVLLVQLLLLLQRPARAASNADSAC